MNEIRFQVYRLPYMLNSKTFGDLEILTKGHICFTHHRCDPKASSNSDLPKAWIIRST